MDGLRRGDVIVKAVFNDDRDQVEYQVWEEDDSLRATFTDLDDALHWANGSARAPGRCAYFERGLVVNRVNEGDYAVMKSSGLYVVWASGTEYPSDELFHTFEEASGYVANLGHQWIYRLVSKKLGLYVRLAA